MTMFEDWFRLTRGTEPNLDPDHYDNDLYFKMAYEAGYRQREEEIQKLYRKVMNQ